MWWGATKHKEIRISPPQCRVTRGCVLNGLAALANKPNSHSIPWKFLNGRPAKMNHFGIYLAQTGLHATRVN